MKCLHYLGSPCFECISETYCSRSGVGDLAGVLCPLVIVTVFVGKGAVENIADVRHRVHADCRALEHRT